jgi:hypothetical protein
LQHPANAALVNRIAIEPVNIPTHNAVGFAALNAVKHYVEKGTPRLFGGSAFFEGVHNGKSLPLGRVAQFPHLRVQARDLPRFLVGAFAGIIDIDSSLVKRV